MRRKKIEETSEYQDQAVEATNEHTPDDVVLTDKKQNSKKLDDASLQEIIANNTELWYKEEVLNLLATIMNKLIDIEQKK